MAEIRVISSSPAAFLPPQMDWATQQHVNEAAPSHLQLPTGSTVPIDYSGAQPSAAVKMQEVFGLADTPLLGGHAKVPLVLELLSPAGRPLQVRLL
jgi:ATP-dependent helicase HrpB